MNTLVIERVTVAESRVEAVVRVLPERLRTSSEPELSGKVLALLPGLSRHTCDNRSGRPFTAELRDTETAHLLEHVTCELMALAGSPRSLKAETAWDFNRDGHGVFRVKFDYDDDLVALGALKHAAQVVDWLFGNGEAPDTAAAAGQLRALRGGSAV